MVRKLFNDSTLKVIILMM